MSQPAKILRNLRAEMGKPMKLPNFEIPKNALEERKQYFEMDNN